MFKITKDGFFKETKKAGVPGAIASHPNIPANPIDWFQWVKDQYVSHQNDVLLRNVIPHEQTLKQEVANLELHSHAFYGFKCAVVSEKGGHDAKGNVYVTPKWPGGFKTMSYKQALYVQAHLPIHSTIIPSFIS
jgi:hypothetical protein